MAEIATLTALFTADLTQFEIGVARATGLMSNANGRISADLSAIASAAMGMSNTVSGALNSIGANLSAITGATIGMSNTVSRALNSIGANLSAITGATIGMSNTVSGALNGISIAIYRVIADINALKAAIASIPPIPNAGAGKSAGGNSGAQIQGGTFIFNGVQDVDSLYDALQDVSRARSPL